MYKKLDAGAELLFCLSKPIAFLTFSSHVKVRNRMLRSVIGGKEATQPTDTPLASDFSQPIRRFTNFLYIL